MADTPNLRRSLVAAFKRIHDASGGTPEWAWPFRPPIPLVGDAYRTGKSLLVYASAENLSWLNEEDAVPLRFTSEKAWDRYRHCLAEMERRGPRGFFPNVGIQPLTDGGLLAAALHLAGRIGLPQRREPRAFVSTVALSNWCKFTVRSDGNKDYAGDRNRLLASLPYVVAELSVLRPAAVLLPVAIWRRRALSTAMLGASPSTRFVPAYQCNAGVINRTLKKKHRAGLRLMREHEGTALGEWMSRVERVNTTYAWRYLAHLDECL